jgi:uncharacterized protein (DUF924 family)
MTAISNDPSAVPSATAVPAFDSEAVLAFWFGVDGDHPEARGNSRAAWFKKDAAFDDEIRTRFLPCYEAAAAGALAHWLQMPRSCLALIVVLDQFPRNMFRNSPRAFAADPLARAATEHALGAGFDLTMLPVERQFVYLPLEHSESLTDQERCLLLMKGLAEFPQTRDLHIWAEKHRVIIARFGRFPHRNAVLERESTAEETAFLAQPGSGF